MSSSGRTRAAQFLVAVLVGAGTLALALRGVQWPALRDAILGVDLGRFGVGVALFAALHLTRAWRWGMLVKAVQPQVRFRSYFSICCVGFFLINVLPFRLGEFVRPWLLAEREKIPWGSGMATVVVERVLDVATLGVLLLGAVAFAELPTGPLMLGGRPYDVVAIGRTAVLGALLPMGAVLAGLILSGEKGVRVAGRVASLAGPRVQALAERFVRAFVEALRALGSWRRAWPVLLSTVAVWTINTVSISVAANAFHLPHVLSFWDGAALLTTICALLMLPAPPGFAGVFEFGVTLGLSIWDVDQATAAAFALTLHSAQFLMMATLGTFFLVVDRIPIGSVLQGIRRND